MSIKRRGKPKAILTYADIVFLLKKYTITLNGEIIECASERKIIKIFEENKKQNILFLFTSASPRQTYTISRDAIQMYIKYKGEKNLILIQQLVGIYSAKNIDILEEWNDETFNINYNNLVLKIFAETGFLIEQSTNL